MKSWIRSAAAEEVVTLFEYKSEHVIVFVVLTETPAFVTAVV